MRNDADAANDPEATVKTGKTSAVVFDDARAAKYDEQWAKLAAMRQALQLFTRVALAELPADAHVLCVGVGTGAELLDLADHHPLWRFTAVEPAAPMLEICRRKAEERGIAPRCTFHEGYLDSLSRSAEFNASTCFLVSHFLTKIEERQALFADIASRLLPEGILVSADISGDMTEPGFSSQLSIWLRMLHYAGFPPDEVDKMHASLGVDVAVLPSKEIEGLIRKSGFEESTLIFQSLLVHAWCSRLAKRRK